MSDLKRSLLGSRGYWLAFASCLVLAVFGRQLAGLYDGSKPALVYASTHPASQSAEERRLADDLPEPDWSLSFFSGAEGEATPEMIIGPVRLEAGEDGHLFVVDSGAGRAIKELSPAGDHVATYGGEEHFRSVTDLAVSGERLWVADLLDRAIYVFDRGADGASPGRLEPSHQPYRLETFGDRDQLVMMRAGTDQLFDRLDAEGASLGRFGALLESQETYAVALDGYIARGKSRLFYSGLYLGVLAAFSPEGELDYLVRTISGATSPKVFDREDKIWVDRSAKIATRSIGHDGDTVYLLTRERLGLGDASIVDLYAADSGQYRRSLVLPRDVPWSQMAVGGGYLYAASRSGVARWTLAEL